MRLFEFVFYIKIEELQYHRAVALVGGKVYLANTVLFCEGVRMMKLSAGKLFAFLLLVILSVCSHAAIYENYTNVFQIDNKYGLGPLRPFEFLGYGKTDGIGCFYGPGGNFGTTLHLFANSGAGLFTEIDLINYDDMPISITGDFNGDGFSDFFIRGNEAYGDTDCYTFVRDSTGLGDGIFFNPGYNGYISDSGDFNDDSIDDICGVTDSRVFIWYSDGTGDFTTELVSDSLGATIQVRCKDLDNDDDLDIFVQLAGNVIILENNGSNIFSEAFSSDLPPFTYYTSISFSDLDNNSYQDIILTNQNESNETVLAVFMNMGSMGFLKTETIFDEEFPFSVFCKDFDLDGKSDLAINMSHHMSIFRGNGDGSFESAPSLFESDNFGGMLFQDYDLDGDQDMAAVYLDYSYSYLRIYFNSTISAGMQESSRPQSIPLLTAVQNPFSFSVEFNVSNTLSPVTLQILDLCGRTVLSLTTDNQGYAVWNGLNSEGQQVPSGTYLIRAQEISCNHLKLIKI